MLSVPLGWHFTFATRQASQAYEIRGFAEGDADKVAGSGLSGTSIAERRTGLDVW